MIRAESQLYLAVGNLSSIQSILPPIPTPWWTACA